MCLIALALHQHVDFPLVLAGNRDEFYQRPSLPADWWPDAPDLLAGRDLQGGGTWMGVTRSGRLAALTNYRAPREQQTGAPSRGALTSDFLRGSQNPLDYLAEVEGRADRYNGFNLLLGQGTDLYYYSNRGRPAERLQPGIYGLSNALLDTPWPKTRRLCDAMQAALVLPSAEAIADYLLQALADPAPAADDELPDTGIGLEWERRLSSVRVASAQYGTRCSTVLLYGRDGNVVLVEQSYPPENGVRRHQFQPR